MLTTDYWFHHEHQWMVIQKSSTGTGEKTWILMVAKKTKKNCMVSERWSAAPGLFPLAPDEAVKSINELFQDFVGF